MNAYGSDLVHPLSIYLSVCGSWLWLEGFESQLHPRYNLRAATFHMVDVLWERGDLLCFLCFLGFGASQLVSWRGFLWPLRLLNGGSTSDSFLAKICAVPLLCSVVYDPPVDSSMCCQDQIHAFISRWRTLAQMYSPPMKLDVDSMLVDWDV